jgi:hypothetical protein
MFVDNKLINQIINQNAWILYLFIIHLGTAKIVKVLKMNYLYNLFYIISS